MIEIEKTYLAQKLPDDLESCGFKEISDLYIPKSSRHPTLRIRKRGDKNGYTFEITNKEPLDYADVSRQEEKTFSITEIQFDVLNKLEGKRVRKLRYSYNYNGRTAEIDVFQDELFGLVLVDFEFKTIAEKDEFQIPDFCLADVTSEEFLAGGMLAGKTYGEIEGKLNEFNYQKLFLE